MDLLGQYENWSGSSVSGEDFVDVGHDQPFKARHGDRCECYGAVIIYAGYLCFLGHRDYDGLLETCRYYILDQGEFENISWASRALS